MDFQLRGVTVKFYQIFFSPLEVFFKKLIKTQFKLDNSMNFGIKKNSISAKGKKFIIKGGGVENHKIKKIGSCDIVPVKVAF